MSISIIAQGHTASRGWNECFLTSHLVLTPLLPAASHPIKISSSALWESLFLKKNSIFTGTSQNKLLPSPAVRSKLHKEHFSSLGKVTQGSRQQDKEERWEFNK